MSYHIMYTQVKASTRFVRVMDFKGAQTIDLTLDEIKDIQDPELINLLEENRREIESGRLDYKPKNKPLK